MAEHLTIEQQEEQIKKWIKENWFAVVAGLVIGFSGLFGWRYYQAEKTAHAEAASNVYEQLSVALNRSNEKAITATADKLLKEFKDTPYASYAALAKAKLSIEKGKPGEAESQFEWVISHSDLAAIKNIARLRFGRLLLSEGKYDNALSLLMADKSASFSAAFAELKGDIYIAKGDHDAARKAYQQALQAMPEDAASRAAVQMKLDDVAPVSKPQAEATS